MKIFKKSLHGLVVALSFGIGLVVSPTLAAAAVADFPSGLSNSQKAQYQACMSSDGEWKSDKCVDKDGATSVQDNIKLLIQLMSFVAGIVAVFVIIIAGIRFVTSNGDSQVISKAKSEIIYAVIGLVVLVLAYAIVNFVIENI